MYTAPAGSTAELWHLLTGHHHCITNNGPRPSARSGPSQGASPLPPVLETSLQLLHASRCHARSQLDLEGPGLRVTLNPELCPQVSFSQQGLPRYSRGADAQGNSDAAGLHVPPRSPWVASDPDPGTPAAPPQPEQLPPELQGWPPQVRMQSCECGRGVWPGRSPPDCELRWAPRALRPCLGSACPSLLGASLLDVSDRQQAALCTVCVCFLEVLPSHVCLLQADVRLESWSGV